MGGGRAAALSSTVSPATAQSLELTSVTEGNLRPTAICDCDGEVVQAVVRQLEYSRSDLAYLQAAHRFLCTCVTGVYTLDECQPASRTLLKRKGSCSQRFACLEALARARTIATRVRGLWIDGRFWAPRFRLTRPLIPRQILLAWPQFYVNDAWLGAESLFGPVESLAQANSARFTNDAESLFDAVGHVAIDFEGRTASCTDGHCDLSRFVVGDAGTFVSRDELFGSLPLLQDSLRGRAFELIFGGRKST